MEEGPSASPWAPTEPGITVLSTVPSQAMGSDFLSQKQR